MGTTDRIIRLIIALVIAGLYAMGTITGTIGIVLLCVAGIFTLTSFIGVCPLYLVLRVSTYPGKKT